MSQHDNHDIAEANGFGELAHFNPHELHTLSALRAHYSVRGDLFSAREIMHLRFLRWLYRTGRFRLQESDTEQITRER